jgi:ribonuclease-3
MFLLRFFQRLTEKPERKKFRRAVRLILGAEPSNLALYELAMRHASAGIVQDGFRQDNERLEYLGDAILGAVVADYLFRHFPYKDEGYLTEIRSRIVSRQSLGDLAVRLGINQLVNRDEKRLRNSPAQGFKSINGDAMEAFIGAIYLDKGYKFSHQFIVKKILHTYLDFDALLTTTKNYKSKLIEWSQREGKKIEFRCEKEQLNSKQIQFSAAIFIDDELIAQGNGENKKSAEQDGARRVCELLEII